MSTNYELAISSANEIVQNAATEAELTDYLKGLSVKLLLGICDLNGYDVEWGTKISAQKILVAEWVETHPLPRCECGNTYRLCHPDA